MIRLTVSLLLVLLTFLLSFTRIHAQSPDTCNNFERIQSIILSERTRGSLAEDIEIARVALTKGVCYLDGNFYTGYGIADRIMRDEPVRCIANTHCRAYYLLSTIDPDVREPAAMAAYIALTEQPRIPRYHFDSWGSTATWWDSLSACPNGWFVIGLTKVC